MYCTLPVKFLSYTHLETACDWGPAPICAKANKLSLLLNIPVPNSLPQELAEISRQKQQLSTFDLASASHKHYPHHLYEPGTHHKHLQFPF